MSAISQCHEPGLLLVFSRPKSSRYLSEFHDWYNTEHGPARMKLEFVENGFRYKGVDETSLWAAMYDLERVSATAELQYTNLRSHRSLREQSVMLNMVEILNRKIYKHVSTRGCSLGPAPVLTCVSFVVACEDVEEVNRWYEEQHIEDLSRIPGWRRSRRFQVVDGPVPPGCAELLAIHEFEQDNGLGGPEHMRARYRPWREKIVQLAKSRSNQQFRFFHEFRAEDYTAPPETAMTAYVDRHNDAAVRRSSLLSGHNPDCTPHVGVGFNATISPEVH